MTDSVVSNNKVYDAVDDVVEASTHQHHHHHHESSPHHHDHHNIIKINIKFSSLIITS
jgi:hypothetical protein